MLPIQILEMLFHYYKHKFINLNYFNHIIMIFKDDFKLKVKLCKIVQYLVNANIYLMN